MKKTIISAIVSVVCTIAICVTVAVCVNSSKPEATATSPVAIGSTDDAAYLTEAQAAQYLGLTEARLVMLRKNLKYLEGSYMEYVVPGENGAEVSVVMYSKDGLDKAITKLMSDSKTNYINFKSLEQVLNKAK